MYLLCRQVPEGTGWILDGFPTTLTQAVLLEKALSGYDAVSSGDKLLEPVPNPDTKKPFSKSNLVPDPRPPPPAPKPVSGLDVVIVLDLPDHLCLERAVHADVQLAGILLLLNLLAAKSAFSFLKLHLKIVVSSVPTLTRLIDIEKLIRSNPNHRRCNLRLL
jgi:hypothetical protein